MATDEPENTSKFNSDLWDDYDLLLPGHLSCPIKEVNAFTYKQMTQEQLWVKLPHKEINIKSGQESIGQLPYSLPYRRILFHNSKYLVGLGNKTDPIRDQGKEGPTETPITQIRMPARPNPTVAKKWQVEGISEIIAEYNDTTANRCFLETPLLFKTFDTVIEEDDLGSPVYVKITDHPRTKKILEQLASPVMRSKPTLLKEGRLFVGRFESPTSNRIDWNTSLLSTLPFHAQCTGIDRPGWEFVMISVHNKLLSIWDLSVPEVGPIFQCELTHEFCSTKAIIDLVATVHYIALLDGNKHLTIIPLHGFVLPYIHTHFQGNPKIPRTSAQVRKFLVEEKLQVVNPNLLSTFSVPTALALGCNLSFSKTLYIGTTHGYLHELSICRYFPKPFFTPPLSSVCKQYDINIQPLAANPRLTEKTIELSSSPHISITHDFTYCLSVPGPVQFIQGRAGRVICGTDHNVYQFSNSNDPTEACLHIETGSGHQTKIRNVLFQGNLILLETNNRHLLIIHPLLEGKQRVLPSSLGSRISDPNQELTQRSLRDHTQSLIYWDNQAASIRIAYGTLLTETWQLPEFNALEPKANPKEEKTETVTQ
jgi:hypothetical protein